MKRQGLEQNLHRSSTSKLRIVHSFYMKTLFRQWQQYKCKISSLCMILLDMITPLLSLVVLLVGMRKDRLGTSSNYYCRSCESEEENEIDFQFNLQRFALATKWESFLASCFLSRPLRHKSCCNAKFILDSVQFLTQNVSEQSPSALLQWLKILGSRPFFFLQKSSVLPNLTYVRIFQKFLWNEFEGQ